MVKPHRRVRLAFACLLLAGLTGGVRAQSFQDYFTNRLTFTNTLGDLSGNNTTATAESGEPKHGGKTGGHSLWISWVAPTNGVIRFHTTSSSFDTLLSAYQFTTTNGTTFANLREVARQDDDSDVQDFSSSIEFGVQAGERYEIAVDGYFGATGQTRLRWSFDPLDYPPVKILSMPGDRVVNIGDAVELVANVTNLNGGQLRWYFNGNNLGVNTTNLVINSFQPANVGRYSLRISTNSVQYFSVPAEIQINTEGATNTFAQDKVLDAGSTSLLGGNGGGSPFKSAVLRNASPPPSGVVRGYNGSQIFYTTYSTVDPNEPAHCSVSGGKSYWLLYQPPANGTVTLDTIGSTYDTVIEVYTYEGSLNSYTDLISLQCENDSFGSNGPARVSFPVVTSRQYLVVLEGVAGTSGTGWLNYGLNTNQAPQPPTLQSPVTNLVVRSGSPATLGVNVVGAPPLKFAWKKNQTPLPAVTGAAYPIANAALTDAASYVITVTNDLGSLVVTQSLNVVIPPASQIYYTTGGLKLGVPTRTNQTYDIVSSTNISGPWQPWLTNHSGDGLVWQAVVPVELASDETRFFRVLVR